MTKKDEWVRVKSESELRVGMCVELRPCLFCGRTERIVLLSRAVGTIGIHVDGSLERAAIAFYTAGYECRTGLATKIAVRDGRLFRLSDSQLTESDTTQELERVR